ncbi:hypothetical protein C4D60_Mb03t22780 [Musa balbisiana]|uniref:Uncharacterized protein n=1 Tax=Musa balbisiana TaxID=52838 RepID=A0A4S8JBZ5_MUSBA|nr:hypothetical protein C4D60_Mb03t22780 [Musa balbisiana]
MTDYDGIGAVRTQALTKGNWIDANNGMTTPRFCKSMELMYAALSREIIREKWQKSWCYS